MWPSGVLVMISPNNNSKIQIQRPGPDPVSRWSKPGFSPGLTGFGRVCPALTGYNSEQRHCLAWTHFDTAPAGRDIALRCPRPRSSPDSESGQTKGAPLGTFVPSPDVALPPSLRSFGATSGDGDGAARQSLPRRGQFRGCDRMLPTRLHLSPCNGPGPPVRCFLTKIK